MVARSPPPSLRRSWSFPWRVKPAIEVWIGCHGRLHCTAVPLPWKLSYAPCQQVLSFSLSPSLAPAPPPFPLPLSSYCMNCGGVYLHSQRTVSEVEVSNRGQKKKMSGKTALVHLSVRIKHEKSWTWSTTRHFIPVAAICISTFTHIKTNTSTKTDWSCQSLWDCVLLHFWPRPCALFICGWRCLCCGQRGKANTSVFPSDVWTWGRRRLHQHAKQLLQADWGTRATAARRRAHINKRAIKSQ